jgi:hypothetical protein
VDFKELDRKRKAFKQDSKIVSEDVWVDTETEDNDETRTVERVLEGQLAVDVRKRVKASADAVVSIVEVDQQTWVSDITASNDYQMTVKCNGVEKSFNTYSASENFRKLVEWLDEDPS